MFHYRVFCKGNKAAGIGNAKLIACWNLKQHLT